jgi:hypothetical protein
MTLEQAIEQIDVFELDPSITRPNLSGWYAVSNNKGIIAYFGNESDALRFRLSYVNALLNPISNESNNRN